MNPTVFYILAATVTASTLLAITSRQLIHAVVYLVLTFFSLALIFYLMGAPLIAALEVIIYAGAIMVLFLFIIMMLEMGSARIPLTPFWRVWGPAIIIGLAILVCSALLFVSAPGTYQGAPSFFVSPRAFGQALYTRFMLGVEIVSLLLLFALVGALYLGRRE